VSTLATAGVAVAACAKTAEPTTAPEQAATATPKTEAEPTATPVPQAEPEGGEAPTLAELVAAGTLPAVDERLPENPLVLEGMHGMGNYGGAMRRGLRDVRDRTGPDKCTAQRMIFWDLDLNLRPNIAAAWESSADGSTWTFTLRRGMKWSDGAPFTAKDIQWWYDNHLMYTDLVAKPGRHWTTGTEATPLELTTPDDYTVVLEFADPKPLFGLSAAQQEPWRPAHYVEQFHPEFTPQADLDQRVAEADLDTWQDLYNDRNAWYYNPELPIVDVWSARNEIQNELFVMERNPYLSQVDTEGNQLPYIDELVHRHFGNADVFNMWIINGEIDYQGRHVALANLTLYKENEESGGFKVHLAASDSTDTYAINHTIEDPNKQAFFRNRDCRFALNYAINRNEVNELVYEGLYIPRQYSPPSNSPQYYPKLTEAYLEYDPDKANALLDEAGYTERDGEGYRLWLDGSGRVGFVIESSAAVGSAAEDEMQMVARYWADIGLDVDVKLADRGLIEERKGANLMDCRNTWCSRAVLPLVDPSFFCGFAGDKTWAQTWTNWRNDPTQEVAEEPPADHWMREIWRIWDEEINTTVDADEQTALFHKILDIWYEELPMISVIGEGPAPLIVKDGLRGLDIDYHMPYSNPTRHGGFVPLQTYYWEDPENHEFAG
jgi:peptide/nickel transport system substrate-binding protein